MSIGIAGQQIITKGFCGVNKSGIVTTKFSLYCTSRTFISKEGGGGPYPGPAWNKVDSLQDFYTPVHDAYVSNDVTITITISMFEHKVTKTITVPEKRRLITIKLFKFIDATAKHIQVKIDNFTSTIGKVTVKMINKLKR